MAIQVQSFRGVGSKRGYPYFAFGLYEPRQRQRDGVWTWRLVRSGPWVRSDVAGRTAFEGVVQDWSIRHGSPVAADDVLRHLSGLSIDTPMPIVTDRLLEIA